MDIEVPAQNPRTFSHIKRDGRHLLQLETVLMTVYYPSALGSGSGTAPGGEKKWARQTWIPRPRVRESQGYGKFAGVGNLILPFFGATNIFTKLPAFRNAALASHWPEKGPSGSEKEGDNSNPSSTSDAEPPKFPLLFFSHGLGGLRTTYSSLCGEFASYGFVCVALEHRDGSCPRTFVCHPRDGQGSIREREEKGGVDHSPEEKRQNFDVIDYIWPKDNPYDTAPTNDKGPDFDLRHAQMDLRMAEVDEAYHVICEMVKGNGEAIATQNMRCGGFIGGNSRGLKGIDWPSWTDRVYLDRVTMIGHSFGSATTVKILRDPSDRFSYISQGIIYDIWGQPLTVSPSQASPNEKKKPINTPLLAINSEAFSYWQPNFDLVKSLALEAREQNTLAWLMTVRGTIHINASDFAAAYPFLTSIALKMTADPKRALDIHVNSSLEFFKIVMPERLTRICRDVETEGLLQMPVVDLGQVPCEERREPPQKYIASRLKIPHEARYRLKPGYSKQVRERNTGASAGSTPGDEIWMHLAPTKDELALHGVDVTHDSTRDGVAKSGTDQVPPESGFGMKQRTTDQSHDSQPRSPKLRTKLARQVSMASTGAF